jgi:hypothetical protein
VLGGVGKDYKNAQNRYISHTCGEVSDAPILTKFFSDDVGPNVMTCAQFGCDRFRFVHFMIV